jgi:hypothetical protein
VSVQLMLLFRSAILVLISVLLLGTGCSDQPSGREVQRFEQVTGWRWRQGWRLCCRCVGEAFVGSRDAGRGGWDTGVLVPVLVLAGGGGGGGGGGGAAAAAASIYIASTAIIVSAYDGSTDLQTAEAKMQIGSHKHKQRSERRTYDIQRAARHATYMTNGGWGVRGD